MKHSREDQIRRLTLGPIMAAVTLVLALQVLPLPHLSVPLMPDPKPATAMAQADADIDVDFDADGEWYETPLWIAIFIIAGLVIVVLIIMAAHGRGGAPPR